MKCLACDAILTDFESSRRSTVTGDYIDLCNDCLVHVPTILKPTVRISCYLTPIEMILEPPTNPPAMCPTKSPSTTTLIETTLVKIKCKQCNIKYKVKSKDEIKCDNSTCGIKFQMHGDEIDFSEFVPYSKPPEFLEHWETPAVLKFDTTIMSEDDWAAWAMGNQDAIPFG